MREQSAPSPNNPPTPLLTTQQISLACTSDLRATVLELRAHLRAAEERNLLSAATAWLADHQIPQVARLFFETNQWENDNYYDNGAECQDASGDWLEQPPPEAAEALAAAIERPLNELSDLHGPLSRDDTLIVDLIRRTVDRC